MYPTGTYTKITVTNVTTNVENVAQQQLTVLLVPMKTELNIHVNVMPDFTMMEKTQHVVLVPTDV